MNQSLRSSQIHHIITARTV